MEREDLWARVTPLVAPYIWSFLLVHPEKLQSSFERCVQTIKSLCKDFQAPEEGQEQAARSAMAAAQPPPQRLSLSGLIQVDRRRSAPAHYFL